MWVVGIILGFVILLAIASPPLPRDEPFSEFLPPEEENRKDSE